MKRSHLVGLLTAFLGPPALAPPPSRVQVVSVTVGIQPKCPYGLGVCWPEAYEGLTMMDGVRSVDRQPAVETWTGMIRTKDGVIPDPEAWARGFKSVVGGTFGFRGVEVTVVGDLVVEDQGRLSLKVDGSQSPLRLAPLAHKVQWDPAQNREQPATEDERSAYRRLADRAKDAPSGRSARVQITGPLESAKDGSPPVLTVRVFTWP